LSYTRMKIIIGIEMNVIALILLLGSPSGLPGQ